MVDGEKKRIFLSYSRDDRAFAALLKQSLEELNYDVFMDLDRVYPGEKWRERIENEISESYLVVFVVSPPALLSKFCKEEIEIAQQAETRIITVMFRRTEDALMIEALTERQWVSFEFLGLYYEDVAAAARAVRAQEDAAVGDPVALRIARDAHDVQAVRCFDFHLDRAQFDLALNELKSAIDLDGYLWLDQQKPWLARARKWKAQSRPWRLLLNVSDLSEARSWHDARPPAVPDPNPLVIEFVQASEAAGRRAKRVRTTLTAGVIVALAAAAIVVTGAMIVAQQERKTTEEALRDAEASRRDAVRAAGEAIDAQRAADAALRRADEARERAETEQRWAEAQTARYRVSEATREAESGQSVQAVHLTMAALFEPGTTERSDHPAFADWKVEAEAALFSALSRGVLGVVSHGPRAIQQALDRGSSAALSRFLVSSGRVSASEIVLLNRIGFLLCLQEDELQSDRAMLGDSGHWWDTVEPVYDLENGRAFWGDELGLLVEQPVTVARVEDGVDETPWRCANEGARLLAEGGAEVWALAYDDEREHLAVARLDGVVRIRAGEAFSEIAKTTLPDGVNAIALEFDRTSGRLVIGDSAGQVLTLDPRTGRAEAFLPTHRPGNRSPAAVLAIAIGQDGLFATADEIGRVILRDVGAPDAGSVVTTLSERVFALSFSDDGARLVAVSAMGELHLVDVAARSVVHREHYAELQGAGSAYFASAPDEVLILPRDAEHDMPEGGLAGPVMVGFRSLDRRRVQATGSARVTSALSARSGGGLAGILDNGDLVIWPDPGLDAAPQTVLRSIVAFRQGSGGRLRAVDAQARVFEFDWSALNAGAVRPREAAPLSRALAYPLETLRSAILRSALVDLPNDLILGTPVVDASWRRLAAASDEGDVFLVDLEAAEPTARRFPEEFADLRTREQQGLIVLDNRVQALALSDGAARIAVANDRGDLWVGDPEKWDGEFLDLNFPDGGPTALSFSPSATRLALGFADGMVKILDIGHSPQPELGRASIVAEFPTDGTAVREVRYSEAEDVVTVVTQSGTVFVQEVFGDLEAAVRAVTTLGVQWCREESELEASGLTPSDQAWCDLAGDLPE